MGAPRFLRGRRFLVETFKVEQGTVVSEDGRPRNLGTQDTEGLEKPSVFALGGQTRSAFPSVSSRCSGLCQDLFANYLI